MSRQKSNKPTKETVNCNNCGNTFERQIRNQWIIGRKNNACSPQCKATLNKSFGKNF